MDQATLQTGRKLMQSSSTWHLKIWDEYVLAPRAMAGGATGSPTDEVQCGLAAGACSGRGLRFRYLVHAV